ncbi:hypothetical protein A8W25_01220 [Streptomyces sp. ERV7]|nr:hypothetical protein A8W25_01220 [Streptomyces sp. ERV7]
MLNEQFDISGGALEFQPLGEDSWSYRLDDLWVSVRRDLRGHAPASYEAARLLADAGLNCVLAPLAGADGGVSHRVGDFPVVVFPYVSGMPLDTATLSKSDLDTVIGLMRSIHRVDISRDLPAEDYGLSFESDLFDALTVAEGKAPDTGPYGARAHALLRRHYTAVTATYEELTGVGRRCAESDVPLVITHGEPGAPNILRTADSFLFADWGEAMWGPAERDWFHFARTLGRAPSCRPDFLRFYEMRWRLNEIAEYAAIFFAEHADDREMKAMWRRMVNYLPEGH